MVRTSLLLFGALLAAGCSTHHVARADNRDCVVRHRAVTVAQTVTVRDRGVVDPAQQQFVEKTVPVTRMVPTVVCQQRQ